MSKSVYFLTILWWLIYTNEVHGDCSYYQDTMVTFPTGQCINSTLNKANNKRSSSAYVCGLFGGRINKREYSSSDCSGSYTQTNLGCTAPECNCHSSTSQCTTTTVTYDRKNCEAHDKYENITIIIDECINKKKFYIKSGGLYVASYDDVKCDGYPSDTIHLSCYTVNYDINGDTETDIDTDTILTARPISSTLPSKQDSRLELVEFKGLFIVCIVGVMVVGTLCSICCIMRKHRKNQRNQIGDIGEDDERVKKLIENDVELNNEGIKNEQHEIEEIEIPGKAAKHHRVNDNFVDVNNGELDQNVVDKIVNEYINYKDDNDDGDDDDEDNHDEQDDIPVAAFSDFNHENEYDEEIEISEGNEGMMDDAEDEHDENGEEESGGGQDIDDDDE